MGGCLCKGQGFSCVWMVLSRRQSQGEVGERARWSERKRKLLGRRLCTNELLRSTWLLHYCGFGQALFYREVELKHGRVAMLAALGFLVGEQYHPLFGGDI